MDRVIPKKVTKSGRLNDRYILKECLFSNELGQLNYARDTRHSAGMAPGADVLIHLFPDQAVSSSQLVDDFNRLQRTIKTSSYPVLPVLDYGWVGNSAYFVMVAPGSWAAKVLPNLQGKPSIIHCDAIKLTSKLLKEQLVSRGLVPQAFLVTPGGLKVLGTVLTEQFQKNQREMTLLPSNYGHKKDHKVISMALSFSVLAGIALTGSNYFYQRPELTKESVINAKETHSRLTPATLASNPVTTSPAIEILTAGIQEQEPTTEPEEVLTQATTIVLMEDLPHSFPATEFPDKDLQAKNKHHTANGLNHKQLIERAYTAIREGNLSEQPGAGSIYYIRLLKRTSPAHPQVRQLAREVVSAYHIKAQTSVKLKQTKEASQHLWIAGRLIKEFNLNKINRSHLVLKQRLAE